METDLYYQHTLLQTQDKMKGQISIHYDEEGDFLEIMFGEPRSDYGDHFSEDIVLFKDQENDEIIGIGIYNFKQNTKNLEDLKVNLPVKINLSQISV